MTGAPHLTVQSNGKKIDIYPLLTGMIAEKESLHHQKYQGILNKAGFLWDRSFTEFEPVWAWLVVHDEGIFLIDTGLSPGINEPAYLAAAGVVTKWFLRTQFRYEVPAHYQLDTCLRAAGFSPADISQVILTHLHFDHTGNLPLFPSTPVLVSKTEWVNPYRAIQGLLPANLVPELVIFGGREPARDTLTEGGFALTEAADLILVETPGHTFGHMSVLLKADDVHLLFGGDVTSTQQQLLEGIFPLGNADLFDLRMSRWKILDFASRHPLIYLPSHDPLASARLLGKGLLLSS